MSVAQLVLVAVSVAVGLAGAAIPGLRWIVRHAMADAIDRNEHVVDMRDRIESIDRSVNQVPHDGRRLTTRVDQLQASIDEVRGEVRQSRQEAAEQRAAIADRVEVVEGTLGEYPPLTAAQQYEIVRKLARERNPGPDNPEVHP